MAVAVDQKWTYAQQVEKEINAELDKKKNIPSVEHINNLMNEFRTSCLETIFLDFQYATKKGVEARLWTVHTVIKERHKKLISRSQAQEPKNLVEVRKLQKRYADFIKTSQHFYKSYIQRLASTYSGMKGLRRIAHRLSLETLSADDLTKEGPSLERLIDASCHATLLRLGDLSRYRNEIRTKDRSWQAALGYYQLAGDLCPDSGSAHNQMAVIALADQNHLDALYHLYRAITIAEPHPLAIGNLEIEFKKITTAWEKKRISPAKDNEAALILWFVRLHPRLYKGVISDELEQEVLSRLTQLVKEQSFEITLERVVIINIAAENFAMERVLNSGQSAETVKSSELLLRLNVRVITALLQMLRPELEDPLSGEDLPSNSDGSQSTRSREKITAVTRRILPALRQYSSWLASRHSAIAKAANHNALSEHIRQMWKEYADVMTKIVNVFSVGELSPVNYLLEEDEMTVGFKPLRDPTLPIETNLYVDAGGMLKPRLTDPGVERSHPNVEMRARIRDILICALLMQNTQKGPITFDNDNMEFKFVEERLKFYIPEPVQQSKSTYTSPTLANNMVEPASFSNGIRDSYLENDSTASFDMHQSMENDMYRMVDNLVESSSGRRSATNETSYGMHSLTANEVFGPTSSNESSARLQSTPQVLPSFPGIWPSAFTPQPNELKSTSPNRPSTGRQFSPLRFSTNKQQLAAAATLDKTTGYDQSGYGSWGRNSSRPTSASTSQPAHQMLQESLAQQYMQSSVFDSSSIYGNTPRVEHRYSGSGLRAGPYAISNGNNTTTYAGASDFERTTMLQSSIWDGSQPLRGGYIQTPPGGQDG